MDDTARYSMLCDFYGDFLTENQLRAMQMRYDEDLSLGEIAQELGVTRQGVHDTLRRAEQSLIVFEERLGLVQRYEALRVLIAQGRQLAKIGAPGERFSELFDRMSGVWEGTDGL